MSDADYGIVRAAETAFGRIASATDLGMALQNAFGPVTQVAWQSAIDLGAPSAVYRPVLTLDGDMYCALYGVNLQEGCAGFGKTAALAMADFDKNWVEMKAPSRLSQ